MRKSNFKITLIKRILGDRFLYKITLLYKRGYLKYMLYRGNLAYLDDSYRGLGKTMYLLQRAEDKQLPVLVGDSFIAKDYRYRKPTVEVVIIRNKDDLRGKQFKKGVLIDESIDSQIVTHIQRAYPFTINIRGGHVSYNKYKS